MVKKSLGWTIIGTIVGIVIVSSFFIPDETPPSNLPEDYSIKIQDQFNDVKELHFTHMPITYKIENQNNFCNNIQINHFIKGLKLIENITNGTVRFVATDNDSDIDIICVAPTIELQNFSNYTNTLASQGGALICKNFSFDYKVTSINWYLSGILNRSLEEYQSQKLISKTENKTVYEVCYLNRSNPIVYQSEDYEGLINSGVLGEGGIVNLSGKKIIKGVIVLYQEDGGFSRCSFPAKEIHELFHVFGFSHTSEPYFDPYYGYVTKGKEDVELLKDLMRPHLDCSQITEVNIKYISCLKRIYSNYDLLNESCEDVAFLEVDVICSPGWFSVDRTGFCCPESDMKIVNGYCSKEN